MPATTTSPTSNACSLSSPKPKVLKPRSKPAGATTITASAPWEILAERYTIEDVLAADPHDRYERAKDQTVDRVSVPAWLRVGSSADYSIKATPSGEAYIVWSSTLCARLGIKPGGGVSLWQLLCCFDGVDPPRGARWSA